VILVVVSLAIAQLLLCWPIWPVRILAHALTGRRPFFRVPAELARSFWRWVADPQTRPDRPMNPEANLAAAGPCERRSLRRNSSRVTLPLRFFSPGIFFFFSKGGGPFFFFVNRIGQPLETHRLHAGSVARCGFLVGLSWNILAQPLAEVMGPGRGPGPGAQVTPGRPRSSRSKFISETGAPLASAGS